MVLKASPPSAVKSFSNYNPKTVGTRVYRGVVRSWNNLCIHFRPLPTGRQVRRFYPRPSHAHRHVDDGSTQVFFLMTFFVFPRSRTPGLPVKREILRNPLPRPRGPSRRSLGVRSRARSSRQDRRRPAEFTCVR